MGGTCPAHPQSPRCREPCGLWGGLWACSQGLQGGPSSSRKKKMQHLGSSEATVLACLWPEAPPCDLASGTQASRGVKKVPKEPPAGRTSALFASGSNALCAHLPRAQCGQGQGPDSPTSSGPLVALCPLAGIASLAWSQEQAALRTLVWVPAPPCPHLGGFCREREGALAKAHVMRPSPSQAPPSPSCHCARGLPWGCGRKVHGGL